LICHVSSFQSINIVCYDISQVFRVLILFAMTYARLWNSE
jgi:hypothetical protein